MKKEEQTLEHKIEKTVKNIKKYMGYLKDDNCTDIKIFKAVLNTNLWDLAMHQVIDFDLTNHILLQNNLVINDQGKVEEYDPKKHELLYNNYKSYSLA